MKPIKDVTVAELVLGSEAFREVVLSIIDTIVAVKSQDEGEKFSDHLCRRIFTDGEAIKYDPGDEPAMKVT